MRRCNVTDSDNVEEEIDFWLLFFDDTIESRTRLAQTEYEVLSMVQGQLRTKMDISSGSDSLRFQQQFANVTTMLTRVKGDLEMLGVTVETTPGTTGSAVPGQSFIPEKNLFEARQYRSQYYLTTGAKDPLYVPEY